MNLIFKIESCIRNRKQVKNQTYIHTFRSNSYFLRGSSFEHSNMFILYAETTPFTLKPKSPISKWKKKKNYTKGRFNGQTSNAKREGERGDMKWERYCYGYGKRWNKDNGIEIAANKMTKIQRRNNDEE